MRARRASRPPPLSAFRLFRPRRPRLRSWRRGRGEKACAPAPRCRCAPPLASACRVAGAGVARSVLWPLKWSGGACASEAAPLRVAPGRSSPAPGPKPGGGAILFSLRRVWGLRRLRAALKVYRAARAAQCKCGVHGFAMNPCESLLRSTAPYYREARVTLLRRQTACGMRHCCARRIVECLGRRRLVCTSTRLAERHPQGVCRIRKAAEPPTAAQQRMIGAIQIV